MRGAVRLLEPASQAVSYMLGGLVIVLALAVMTTSMSVTDLTAWAWDVLGLTFALLFGGLIFTVLYCWVKMKQVRAAGTEYRPWLTAGVQAANGIATLALTYTLLGISLGIGSLAGQELTPDTIQVVIRGLTDNFSMAFMTTVVGLPTAALLRGLILVTDARNRHSTPGGAPAAARRERKS